MAKTERGAHQVTKAVLDLFRVLVALKLSPDGHADLYILQYYYATHVPRPRNLCTHARQF